jgi:hypothetical protein
LLLGSRLSDLCGLLILVVVAVSIECSV